MAMRRNPLQDLIDFLKLLNKSRVKYVVVGAHAMSQCGYTRATGDLDILVSPDQKNAEKLMIVLKEFGAPISNLKVDDFTKPYSVLQLGVSPLRIDILTKIDGVNSSAALKKSTIGKLMGVKVRFLSYEHLIKNKSSTRRAKDLLDVAELKALKKRKTK